MSCMKFVPNHGFEFCVFARLPWQKRNKAYLFKEVAEDFYT